MANELTTSGDGLRLFFTDDVYLVKEAESQQIPDSLPIEPVQAKVAATVAAAPPEYKFLGNNKRNILILVNDPLHEVSDEKGRELLRKIVKSVNLSANDFALLNYHQYPDSSYTQLMAHFTSTIVFAFGVSSQQLGLPVHPENVVVREGEVMLIFSAELKRLEADMEGKKALWGSLKKLGL
ncbi:hypothetical protein [Pedobacter sp. GR22-6]|uniref:hypothetical protein n=1 Tax=Pedobacter sp. GR22-6 TaxID=3127957 RepID=UPI00307EBA5B